MIQPACLPNSSIVLHPGEEAYMVGWDVDGSRAGIIYHKLEFLDQEQCHSAWVEQGNCTIGNRVCAKYKTGTQFHCLQGGIGLFHVKDRLVYLTGHGAFDYGVWGVTHPITCDDRTVLYTSLMTDNVLNWVRDNVR